MVMKKSVDIVIVGAGVIGLSTALRLVQHGLRVLVVDRQEIGREASWAGAGMLPPGNLDFAETPEARLRAYSHRLWGKFIEELHDLTGVDTGYCRCGVVELCGTGPGGTGPGGTGPSGVKVSSVKASSAEGFADLSDWRQQLHSENLAFEDWDAKQLQEFAPHINREISEALFVPDFGQIRNPRYLKALNVACRLQGVDFLQHDHVALHRSESGVVTVKSAESTIIADTVCVAAGAWSQLLLRQVGYEIPVRPVQGQIVQLRPTKVSFDHVIQVGRRYLVPRKDGLVLVGSTEAFCGYSKQVTSSGLRSLLAFAEQLVPSLGSAEVVRQWAGLRPGSIDELPFLGTVPNCKNLYVAAGHFRSGLQMSVGTAAIMCRLLTGREPEICLDGLQVNRIQDAVG